MQSTPQSYPRLPNIDQNMCFGFNMRTASMQTEKLFDFTYEKNKTVQYHSLTYALPDQLAESFRSLQNQRFSKSTSIIKTEEKFSTMYSVKTSGHYSGLEYSGSIDGSLAYTGTLFEKKDREYCATFARQECATASWDTEQALACLRSEISTALNALPKTISKKSDYDAYKKFFEKHGTHLVLEGTFGGFVTMNSSIDSSFIATSSSTDIATKISGGFQEGLKHGGASAALVLKYSSYLSKYQDSISISIATIGGSAHTDLDKFYDSCFETPVLLLGIGGKTGLEPIFAPLADLVEDQTRKTTMLEAMDSYLKTPHIKGPYNEPFNTVFPASDADSFLLGYVNCIGNGALAYLNGWTGQSSNPTTLRAGASAHFYPKSRNLAQRASIGMPVRKNDYSNVQYIPGYSTINATLDRYDFLPVRGTSVFGEWEDLPNTSQSGVTAKTDGFLSVVVTTPQQDERGHATLEVGGDLRAACSAGYLYTQDARNTENSFCVPVRNGEVYTLTFASTWNPPTFQAAWLPVQGLQFEKAEKRDFATTYTASDTDGFLVAVLQDPAPDNYYFGNYAQAILSAAPSEIELAFAPEKSGASVQTFPQKTSKDIPYNTATLPVPRGWSYKADFNPFYVANSTPPTANLWWVSLVDPNDPSWS